MQTAPRRETHPTASHATTQLRDIRKTLPMRALSEAEWRHWTTQGFVIVDIWNREDLRVAIDRANLNPPRQTRGNPNSALMPRRRNNSRTADGCTTCMRFA
jgi:hypothetical protein